MQQVQTHRRRSPLIRAAPGLLVIASALFFVYIAGTLDWLACLNESAESCDDQEVAQLQYRVSLAGLVPATLFGLAYFLRRRRAALGLLLLTTLVYVTWGILAAAVQLGWNG